MYKLHLLTKRHSLLKVAYKAVLIDLQHWLNLFGLYVRSLQDSISIFHQEKLSFQLHKGQWKCPPCVIFPCDTIFYFPPVIAKFILILWNSLAYVKSWNYLVQFAIFCLLSHFCLLCTIQKARLKWKRPMEYTAVYILQNHTQLNCFLFLQQGTWPNF